MAFESEVDMTPNIDALAEAHYADVDPQNGPSDDDLVEEEWKEEREVKRFQRWIATWFIDQPDENIAYLIKNSSYLGDWLTESLEELR